MVTPEEASNYLVSKGIRKTNFRLELLMLFMNHTGSLSHEEIRSKISSTKDKVTIYRALDAFEKKCLIHKVPNASNTTRYAACNASSCSSSENGHQHNHVHFICTDCEDTFCINEVKIPEINLPKGYSTTQTSLTVKGKCPTCK